MKTFYLTFTKDNLTYEDEYWTSELIDLYNNEFYTNFSVTKSAYGANTLEDGTWVGFIEEDGNTDAGIIEDGRFIDFTGTVDIDRFDVRFTDDSLYTDILGTANIYSTDDPDAYFPDEFASRLNVKGNRSIGWANAYRYAQFQFSLPTELNIDDIDFKFVVTIKIGPPPIAPLYGSTRRLLNKFPEWMAVSADAQPAATPALGRPTTVMGEFLNAVAGEWIEHIQGQLSVQSLEQYIGTLDATMPSAVYTIVDPPEFFSSIEGDGNELARANTLFEFFNSVNVDNVCFISDGEIRTFQEFSSITIDGEEVEFVKAPIWNTFDEFGLMVDLERIKDESNERYRQRILDVYINKPGASLHNFKMALRRELDIWRVDGATPGTEGATPEILDLTDLSLDELYWSDDGMPTEKFELLAEYLCKEYPTTWGYFIWDQAFWDVAVLGSGENYEVLPHRFDATPPTTIQTGVGDGNDLLITKPTNNINSDSLSVTFTARGIEREAVEISPTITVNALFNGQADREEYIVEPLTVNFVLRVEPADTPGEYLYMNFTMTAISDIDWESATPRPNQIDIVAFSDEFYGGGFLGATIIDSDGNEIVLDADNMIPEPLASAAWQTGHWDPDTEAVVDQPADNNFIAWFSEDEENPIDKDTVWQDLPLTTSEYEATPGDYLTGYALFQSTDYDTEVQTWSSPQVPIRVELNGAYPDETVRDFIMDTPTVDWSPYLEGTPNKEYVIQLVDQDDEGNYGAYTLDADDNELFLPASYIYLNGSNTWTDGQMVLPEAGNDELEWSSGTGGAYPIVDAYQNVAFSANFEVGIDDLPSLLEYSSSDFYRQKSDTDVIFLGSFVLSKADFGLDNSEDVIITWLGISANNEQVNVWLESNIVNPLSDLYEDPTYADNVIVEELDLGEYVLTNVVAFMRVKPGANKKWNPQMHTGWFYMGDDEYYVYHKSATETFSTESATLNEPPQQGAPIIVFHNNKEYRQVAFHDATPNLTLTNTEIKTGNGREGFYMAYPDIYDIAIHDNTLDVDVDAVTETDSNYIELATPSQEDHEYEIAYVVRDSFYVDHETRGENYELKPTIVFDHATPGVSVTYETSLYAQSTPIDVPLHPFYTSTEESFIFISESEYEPYYSEIKLSPQVIVDDGQDYMLVTIKCYDIWGNPKIGYDYTLVTTYGELGDNTLTTDEDGYAYTLLSSPSANSTTDVRGTIAVSGSATPGDLLNAEVDYDIFHPMSGEHRVFAMADPEYVPADEKNNVVITGIVVDPDLEPVPYAIVRYRIGKTINDALLKTVDNLSIRVDENLELKEEYDGTWPDTGKTFADENGLFTIGPFTSQDNNNPGFFFAVIESKKAEVDISDGNFFRGGDNVQGWDIVGDIAVWYEYPDATLGVEAYSQLPKQANYITNEESATPELIPNSFPVDYSEYKDAPATPNLFDVDLPRWYILDKYYQYQLGLLGDVEEATVSTYYEANRHPDYKDM
jgi:hypothetical protein